MDKQLFTGELALDEAEQEELFTVINQSTQESVADKLIDTINNSLLLQQDLNFFTQALRFICCYQLKLKEKFKRHTEMPDVLINLIIEYSVFDPLRIEKEFKQIQQPTSSKVLVTCIEAEESDQRYQRAISI